MKIKIVSIITLLFLQTLQAQQDLSTHTRGRLWETLINYGLIGSAGAWDYEEVTGLGFYPGFSGFTFPNDEQLANAEGKVTDANFHNFRSGPWILAKGGQTLVPPDWRAQPTDYLLYHASMAPVQFGVLSTNPPFRKTNNFVGADGFNPLLPEEINYIEVPTATGITVKQRSMQWSYPGFSDFIIYDYTFVNTGDMAIPSLNKTLKLEQTLNEVYFVFHSGISVSTKGNLNFYYDPEFLDGPAPAGGFGGYRGHVGTDVYTVLNDGPDGKGLAYYSREHNGGREPVGNFYKQIKSNWQTYLRIRPEWLPELQDPACFGFVMLYRTPPPGSANPNEPDPDFFSVYNDEGDDFQGKSLDFNEHFHPARWKPNELYNFIRTNYRRPNDNRMYAWYTSTFGPYNLAPGDSVRLIVAEVAGMMDIKEVMMGDPNHHYPDSSIAAMERNIEAARQAVAWGMGAQAGGINLAADVPEAPPAPNCSAATTSIGSDTAIITISWDKLAETANYTDGSGEVFYDGSVDLDGYRIYRSITERGAWDFVADIPRSEFASYWNEEISQYQYQDRNLQFGNEFAYYVQAYNSNPGTWRSANKTVVTTLPELKSADYNRTSLVNARPGPVSLDQGWDVFVAPNPYIEGDPDHSFGEPNPRKIEFRNLPEKATIKIFSLSGDLIATLNHEPDEEGNQFGSIAWDQRSQSGLLVAPGLYVYVVESSTEGSTGSRANGKLMIIR